jgi:hypothetical protein
MFGNTQRDELLIRVEVVLVLHGEAARRHHRAVEADEREAGGAERQRHDIRRIDGGNHQRRKAWRDRAHERHTARTDVEHPRRGDARDDANQRRGCFRRDLPHELQQHQDRHAKDQRRPMRLAQLREELPKQAEESLRLQRKPEQLSKLSADDAQRDAVEVPRQDRACQEVGQESQAQDATGDAEKSPKRGQHHRQGDVPVEVASSEWSNGRRHQRTRRRVRRHDQLTGRAEACVRDERED